MSSPDPEKTKRPHDALAECRSIESLETESEDKLPDSVEDKHLGSLLFWL